LRKISLEYFYFLLVFESIYCFFIQTSWKCQLMIDYLVNKQTIFSNCTADIQVNYILKDQQLSTWKLYFSSIYMFNLFCFLFFFSVAFICKNAVTFLRKHFEKIGNENDYHFILWKEKLFLMQIVLEVFIKALDISNSFLQVIKCQSLPWALQFWYYSWNNSPLTKG
jgi:hypothetical protein